jgi:hypothetical protein
MVSGRQRSGLKIWLLVIGVALREKLKNFSIPNRAKSADSTNDNCKAFNKPTMSHS